MNYKKLKNAWLFLGRHPRLQQIVAFMVLLVVFTAIALQRLDPDFGWHLQAGNYIRAHGIPAHDIYTYTAQSFRWINHEWGNDVILSLIYGWGGYNLVSVFYGVIWSLALLVAGAGARVTVLLAAATAVLPYAGVRPLGWTVLFFAITLQILRSSQYKKRWWLPLLFVIWANIHAGFIAGLGLIVYFVLKERRSKTLALLVICALATLCNTYGLRIYEEVIRTIFDPAIHHQIREWAYFTVLPGSWFFIVVWTVGFCTFDRTDKRRWLGTTPLLFVTALSATRNLPLFVVSGTKELDGYVTKIAAAIPRPLDRSRKIVLSLLIAGLAGGLVYSLHLGYNSWSTNREANYPTQAVAYLQHHRCDGNLFNSYNYGGYLIWKVPGQLVYIDGRMPTWKPYMERYERIINNPKKYYKADFARNNIRCALVSNADSANLVPLLQKAHWHVAVRQPGNSVLLLAP